jgi:2-polyprenyl-6-methoxyphenol hydroxylase-like FAD-dependent oxidoreductase
MDSREARKVALVVGCGVSGPAAAMALQRAGFEVFMYEGFDAPSEHVGSFLDLAPNGIDALRAIGVRRDVVSAGFPIARIVFWSGTGKRLGEAANGRPLPDGTSAVTIRRGALGHALCEEALRRGISIEYGKRLLDAQLMLDRRVVARFEDGTEATGDLLVGADGIRSRTRYLIDPEAALPEYAGAVIVSGVCSFGGLEPTPEAFHVTLGKRALFGHTVRPSGEVYWFASLFEPHEPTLGSICRKTSEEWRRELADLFAEDSGPAADIVRTPTDDLCAYPVYELRPADLWHRAKTVIIGDAAHAPPPMSRQGAALAVEDAVVLGKCARDIDDVDAAIRAYERLRRRRVERVARYASQIRGGRAPGPVRRWLRDLTAPYLLRLSAPPSWLYGYHLDWEEHDTVRAALA